MNASSYMKSKFLEKFQQVFLLVFLSLIIIIHLLQDSPALGINGRTPEYDYRTRPCLSLFNNQFFFDSVRFEKLEKAFHGPNYPIWFCFGLCDHTYLTQYSDLKNRLISSSKPKFTSVSYQTLYLALLL